MSCRLPPQPGEWIDRNRPISFRFEGQHCQGFAGDVISSALWANDVRMLGRSFKYHRPRGIYSLAGHDANALFEDAQSTNIRGDLVALQRGMDLYAVNTAGNLANDRLGFVDRFSKFMPVGFYYKAFHTPRSLFPYYEKQIRKIAGLGSIHSDQRVHATPKDYAFCELLVVGSGPAGLSAALAAADQGVDVLLVDENPRLGGSFTWQWAGDQNARSVCEELVSKVAAHEHVTVRRGTQVAGCYADLWIALVDNRRLTKLRARAMVVATGCMEQPAVFGNNDLPGVMLASAAQRLVQLYAVKPFQRCVVLTANKDGYRAALDLQHVGVDVAAMVDFRSEKDLKSDATLAEQAGIRVLSQSAICEAVSGPGRKSIRGAVVSPLDASGVFSTGPRQTIDCDGIVLSVGWAPSGGPLYQAGARFRYEPVVEQFVPDSLPPGVFASGRVKGIFPLEDQISDGRHAGTAAAQALGKYTGEVPNPLVPVGPAPSQPYPIFPHEKKKNFIDLDEDVHLADLVNAHQEGYDNIELMKRYTTVGMGPSQGKIANMNAVRVLARLNQRSIDETGTTTSRPFHQPVSLEHLAGRRFHPLRRSPLHHWHQSKSAFFFHAGTWLRPEYYAVDGRTREESILEEAQHVRNGVGLIDVSTLGKIEVAGPDACRFLERIYTGRFTKQEVGRLRYALACDELGIVIEDGVIARLAEDRFYVTATTSGANSFFQEMQRWAMIWEMDVVLINATAQLASFNVAGPASREVLATVTDMDLSPEGFPYLGVRTGRVAGVRATLLRVGFVGELGYEIHVPVGYGLALWQTLFDAEASVSIRPFGVEAQRLLRLEKGHLIVGQDTDALTNPYEANLAWAVGRKKEFFVGQRSLQVMAQRPINRKLVGFTMARDFTGPYPQECHLFVEENELVGRVTSFSRRSTLGHPVGLAFLRPDIAVAGRKVSIRVDRGTQVEAEVVPTPFYDPEDLKQK